MAQINTYGFRGSDHYGLAPGKSLPVIMWGPVADFGRIFSVAAVPAFYLHAFGGAGGGGGVEVILEVTDLQYEIGTDGNRRVFFTVRNMGSDDADFTIFYTYTDLI